MGACLILLKFNPPIDVWRRKSKILRSMSSLLSPEVKTCHDYLHVGFKDHKRGLNRLLKHV